MAGAQTLTSSAVDQCTRWFSRQPENLPTEDPGVAAALFAEFVSAGLSDLPLPGAGSTYERFSALAAVAEFDPTLARLVEAHTDAAAILLELDGQPVSAGQLWGVWAAEPPTAKVVAELQPDGEWLLSGRKAWCSGAGICTHALITAHAIDGPRLFAIALDSAGITAIDASWQGVALTGADTRTVDLHQTAAVPVGEPDRYVGRPGFWHGAVGVAAVWYGGAVGIARALAAKAARSEPGELLAAHLGAVDVALGAARASLRDAAAMIDADPHDRAGNAAIVARRARGVVEAAATEVTDRVGRALGAAPLAMDRRHSRRVADVGLYLRQSHGDVDLADLGRRLVDRGVDW